MTMRAALAKLVLQEDINFLLTNRIPRQLANRFIGWFSRIESPLLARASIGLWRLFADLDLSDSATQRFTSLHDCFTRQLKPGARPIDPDPAVVTSPCDAIVGACGRIDHDRLIQAKGFVYTLNDLLVDPQVVQLYIDGHYAALRLTSSMYHRFHAPCDCRIERVTYISGDTWNVNPIALERIERLFCRNARAVIHAVMPQPGVIITMVPVAAILVAGIRLHFLDVVRAYSGTIELHCSAEFRKGQEIGWFEHGSTIIVFAPKGVALCDSVRPGAVIRMGKPLMRLA
ncbi:MAG: phosphatidylserine decarboxylase [Alphaproteobacteria bacterium]|nr:phosphatidylserine decarboxylase [Alphaproteobacteria bacterium]